MVMHMHIKFMNTFGNWLIEGQEPRDLRFHIIFCYFHSVALIECFSVWQKP